MIYSLKMLGKQKKSLNASIKHIQKIIMKNP